MSRLEPVADLCRNLRLDALAPEHDAVPGGASTGQFVIGRQQEWAPVHVATPVFAQGFP